MFESGLRTHPLNTSFCATPQTLLVDNFRASSVEQSPSRRNPRTVCPPCCCHLLRVTPVLAYSHPAQSNLYQRLYGELHTAPGRLKSRTGRRAVSI